MDSSRVPSLNQPLSRTVVHLRLRPVLLLVLSGPLARCPRLLPSRVAASRPGRTRVSLPHVCVPRGVRRTYLLCGTPAHSGRHSGPLPTSDRSRPIRGSPTDTRQNSNRHATPRSLRCSAGTQLRLPPCPDAEESVEQGECSSRHSCAVATVQLSVVDLPGCAGCPTVRGCTRRPGTGRPRYWSPVLDRPGVPVPAGGRRWGVVGVRDPACPPRGLLLRL